MNDIKITNALLCGLCIITHFCFYLLKAVLFQVSVNFVIAAVPLCMRSVGSFKVIKYSPLVFGLARDFSV